MLHNGFVQVSGHHHNNQEKNFVNVVKEYCTASPEASTALFPSVNHHSSLNSIPEVQISVRMFLFNQESKVLNPPPVLSCEIPLTPVEQYLPLTDVNGVRIGHHLSQHS